MDRDEYAVYLASPWWKQRRRRAIQQAGHRCQCCGGYWTVERPIRLQVHHKTYVRLGKERPEDLAVLCKGCHEIAHGVAGEHATIPGPERIDSVIGRVMHFIELHQGRKAAG